MRPESFFHSLSKLRQKLNYLILHFSNAVKFDYFFTNVKSITPTYVSLVRNKAIDKKFHRNKNFPAAREQNHHNFCIIPIQKLHQLIVHARSVGLFISCDIISCFLFHTQHFCIRNFLQKFWINFRKIEEIGVWIDFSTHYRKIKIFLTKFDTDSLKIYILALT